MSIVKRIKKLADSRSLTFAELERKLDFSNGQIRRWEKSNPGIDKVEKIADYFNVSTDYLLGRDEIQYENQDEDILIMHRAAENMSEEQRKKALVILETMFDNWDEISK